MGVIVIPNNDPDKKFFETVLIETALFVGFLFTVGEYTMPYITYTSNFP